MLEIDGRAVAQSNAVARYLARKYGLAGKDEWEELECDVLVDTLQDLKQGNIHPHTLEQSMCDLIGKYYSLNLRLHT